LIWALSAYGPQGLWREIVLRQTVGRVVHSFAHQRPFWWYFIVLPPMLLPWVLSVRAPWRAWRDSFAADKATRFAVAWFLPALASVATAACGMLALAQDVGPYVDVTTAASRIKQIQASGQPIAHLAWHHGLFEFPGRFTQPLEKVNYADLRAWCAAHPDGEIV